MENLAWQGVIRLILYVSWPGLLVGTFLVVREARRFRGAIRNASCGSLVVWMTVGWLVALYCLGFVATSHLLRHPSKDDVLSMAAIFLVSVCVFAALLVGLRRWNREAVELNDLYARLEEMVFDRTADLETQHRRCSELIAALREKSDERELALREKLEEVEAVTRILVAREARMAELKLKIAALKGEALPSAIADA